MGKDLKGKELGKGISQRKDGYYTARFRNRDGKDVQKYFKKLQDCRNWIAEARFQDEHGGIYAMQDMTVNAWAEYWLENIKKPNVKLQTYNGYREKLNLYILPVIGRMLLGEVSPIHCQDILNRMEAKNLSSSSIALARIVMAMLFRDAVDSEMIIRSPVKRSVRSKGIPREEKTVLSREQQKNFLKYAESTRYYNQFALILQTGLRCAELNGLKWEDINFEKRTVHVQRNLNYINKNGTYKWEPGPPKTSSGNRIIPLTDEAVKILLDQKEKCRAHKLVNMDFAGYVFMNSKAKPITNKEYNIALERISVKARIVNHITMHCLRHTFATRCAESGVSPKTLQYVLGHSDIKVTMELYVHATQEKIKEDFSLLGKTKNVV